MVGEAQLKQNSFQTNGDKPKTLALENSFLRLAAKDGKLTRDIADETFFKEFKEKVGFLKLGEKGLDKLFDFKYNPNLLAEDKLEFGKYASLGKLAKKILPIEVKRIFLAEELRNKYVELKKVRNKAELRTRGATKEQKKEIRLLLKSIGSIVQKRIDLIKAGNRNTEEFLSIASSLDQERVVGRVSRFIADSSNKLLNNEIESKRTESEAEFQSAETIKEMNAEIMKINEGKLTDSIGDKYYKKAEHLLKTKEQLGAERADIIKKMIQEAAANY